MSKRLLISGIATLFIFLATMQSISYAGTFTAFGPKAFTRGSGKPVVEKNSFSIRKTDTSYTIQIYNGGTSSEDTRVSSAVITLNGMTLFGPSDFNQQVSFLQKQVNVSNSNQLQVELRSAPESRLTVSIEGEDNVPPSIVITSPANGIYTNVPSAAVIGSASDTISWISNITVNGIYSALTSETYTSIIQLTEGQNTITASATDVAGNTGNSTVSVILDTIPPKITIDTVPFLTNKSQLTITGKIEDASPISSLTVNGTPVTLTNNAFTATVNLAEGSNNIVVVATDKAGNTSSTTVTINLDTTPPIINITSPANGSTVNTKTITVTGTLDDNTPTVTINGIIATVSNNTFTASNINISEGANMITVKATDPAGNTRAASISVTRVTGPSITIQSPADGSRITTPSFTLTGSVTGNYPIVSAFISVNNKPANPVQLRFEGLLPPGKLRYTFSISDTVLFRDLAVGANRVTITATDGAGGISSATITINLVDIIAPVISITSPATGSIVTGKNITVTGIIDDNTASVTVNDINATVSNNAFTAGITLSEGENTITVTAIDPAGNTRTSKITVYLDTIPPAVTYIYPVFNGTEIPVGSLIKVIFSEAINPETITSATFLLKSPTESIAGTVSYSGNTATFKPQKLLSFDTVYTATVKGGGAGIKDLAGNALTTDYVWLFKAETTVEVSITEPNNGATINKAYGIIKGTINAYTNDIGITVNGTIAEINGTNWIAKVPLQIGQNRIEATATDNKGNTDTQTITVNTESTDQPLKISTIPTSGIVPLNTTFSIDTSISNTITSYKIDFEGNGVADLETTDISNITHIYDTPGIYFPTVTVTDSQNITYIESTMINVLSREEMDTLLKGKWDGMKGAMGNGDIDLAVKNFAAGSRGEYKEIFELLAAQLPSLVNAMGDITMVKISEDTAEYYIKRTQRGMEISYFIYFVKDGDGIWRIQSF